MRVGSDRTGCGPENLKAKPDASYLGGSADSVTRVEEAFGCIALVGATGCDFVQPLEATRLALDPTLNIN